MHQVPNTWCFFSLAMTLTMVRGTGQLQALTQVLAHIFLFPNCHKSRLRHKKIETKLLQIETDPPQIDTELPQIETEMLQIKTFFFQTATNRYQTTANRDLTAAKWDRTTTNRDSTTAIWDSLIYFFSICSSCQFVAVRSHFTAVRPVFMAGRSRFKAVRPWFVAVRSQFSVMKIIFLNLRRNLWLSMSKSAMFALDYLYIIGMLNLIKTKWTYLEFIWNSLLSCYFQSEWVSICISSLSISRSSASICGGSISFCISLVSIFCGATVSIWCSSIFIFGSSEK